MLTAVNPRALPRSLGGKTAVIIAGVSAWIIAKPMPCNTLSAVSSPAPCANPQRTLAAVKSAKPPV